MLNAPVSKIEILGIDALELIFPHRSAFIMKTWIEGWLFLPGNKSRYGLHQRKALGFAICGQFFEAIPRKTIRQAGPPSVAQPVKRRAVGMLEIALVGAHS